MKPKSLQARRSVLGMNPSGVMNRQVKELVSSVANVEMPCKFQLGL